MAKDKVVTPEVVVPEAVVVVDYSTMSLEELQQAIGKAWEDKDMKLMGQLSKLYTKGEAEAEKTKRASLLQELIQTTQTVSQRITTLIDELVETGILDGAEGVWYAQDFGEIKEKGINPSCRLVKSRGGAKSEGGVSVKSSYKAGLPSSEDMLKQVGEEVYFEEDTTVTIDKVEQTMPAGMTYKEAYEFSTNGGWRNRVRMALGKKAGLI